MANLDVAMALAQWLQENGCTVTMFAKEDHVEVLYTLKEDIKPQPAIIVREGKVNIPRGSQVVVVKLLLKFITRGKDEA